MSLFLPVLDEEDNLRPMHAKIAAALDALGKTAEVIYVDDGSTDNSLAILKEIAASDDRVRVISFGQTLEDEIIERTPLRQFDGRCDAIVGEASARADAKNICRFVHHCIS